MAAGQPLRFMHAVHYSGYGGGAAVLKHAEVPFPTPKKGEILIKLEAVSLNPIDWKIQEGIFRPFVPFRFPFVPATDVAGEVVVVGAAVETFKIGDKVVSMLSAFSGGGLAEYAIAQVNQTAQRPPEVAPADAAGLPIAGLSALQALSESAGIQIHGTPKTTPPNVLVTAASGGVGHYAVQLAKLAQAHVTATCGARNIELIRSLGADEVLDYKTAEGLALKSPSGRKYDAVIHCTTGISWEIFKANLSENGRVVDLAPSGISAPMCSKKNLIPFMWNPKEEHLEFLVKLLKERKLRTVVDSRYPLRRAQDAWARVMSGHATGKVIVEP